MKINLTLDIDFLNEDETLEEGFKNEIKEAILRSIQYKVSEKLVSEIKPFMDNCLKDNIEKVMDDLLHNYLHKPVLITDGKWVEKYINPLQMMEFKLRSMADIAIENKLKG